MASFSKGTSFTDGVAGDVTAAKLHALVDAATPVPGFITDRTAETSIATDDLVLISDTSDSGALNKMTVANLMKAEMTGTINSTAGTIGTLNSTAGTIGTINSTTASISNTLTLNSVKVDAFPTGTVLLFYQASAPTGWTQVTTQNNKALRVVSGTGGGTGGSTAFTSVFTSRTPSTPSGTISVSGTVGNTTLTSSQIPSHVHSMGQTVKRNAGSVDGGLSAGLLYNSANNIDTDAAGGGGSHNHSWSGSATFSGSAMTAMDFAVQYIDIILASKSA